MRPTCLTGIGTAAVWTLVIPILNAHAELTVFTDRSAWETTVGTIDTEDFNDATLGWLMEGPGFSFLEHRVGKITIGVSGDRLGADNNPTIRDTIDHLSPNGSRHLGGVLSNFEVIMRAVIIFDQPIAAFGADWASAANRRGVTLRINDQTVGLSDHLADNGDGFFGIVAADPFREVFLTSALYEDYGLDNISFPAFGLAGDYDANGTVEQADLDLVLLHWGDSTPPVPSAWTNDLPDGRIDQAELDKVLLHWGNSASVATRWVPEPGSLSLIVMAFAFAWTTSRTFVCTAPWSDAHVKTGSE